MILFSIYSQHPVKDKMGNSKETLYKMVLLIWFLFQYLLKILECPQPSELHPAIFHQMEHNHYSFPKATIVIWNNLYVTIAMKPHKNITKVIKETKQSQPTFPSLKKANWQKKRGKTLPDTPLIDLLFTQTLVVPQMSKPDRLHEFVLQERTDFKTNSGEHSFLVVLVHVKGCNC